MDDILKQYEELINQNKKTIDDLYDYICALNKRIDEKNKIIEQLFQNSKSQRKTTEAVLNKYKTLEKEMKEIRKISLN